MHVYVYIHVYVCVCGKNLANVSRFFPQSFPSIHLLDDIGRDACTIPRIAHPEWWCLQSGATPKIIQNFHGISVFQSWNSHVLAEPHVEKYLLNWSSLSLSLSLSLISLQNDGYCLDGERAFPNHEMWSTQTGICPTDTWDVDVGQSSDNGYAWTIFFFFLLRLAYSMETTWNRGPAARWCLATWPKCWYSIRQTLRGNFELHCPKTSQAPKNATATGNSWWQKKTRNPRVRKSFTNQKVRPNQRSQQSQQSRISRAKPCISSKMSR